MEAYVPSWATCSDLQVDLLRSNTISCGEAMDDLLATRIIVNSVQRHYFLFSFVEDLD